MTAVKQVLPNGENALKAGVEASEGKAISRLNARKHGIFATALTPEDSEELYAIEENLIADLRPVGRVEEMLVETLAMTYLRLQRCARAEAEYHIRTWAAPNKHLQEGRWERLRRERAYGARAVPFEDKEFERMTALIGLYNARIMNQFMKNLQQIERQQRLRAGENAPPPVVADLAVQGDEGMARGLRDQAPALTHEKSQDIEAQGNDAQKAI